MKTSLRTVTLVTLLSLGTAGCSSLSNTQRGAVIGAGAGGALGAIVGNAAGSTAKGAIIGAVVGGAAGAIIGNRMNDRAEMLEKELDNATIERVGEGILIISEVPASIRCLIFSFGSANDFSSGSSTQPKFWI